MDIGKPIEVVEVEPSELDWTPAEMPVEAEPSQSEDAEVVVPAEPAGVETVLTRGHLPRRRGRPYRGYRVWGLGVDEDGECVLESVWNPSYWSGSVVSVGGPLNAAPDPSRLRWDGLWALQRWHAAEAVADFAEWLYPVGGLVELLDEYILHEAGARGLTARVQSLWPLDSSAQRLWAREELWLCPIPDWASTARIYALGPSPPGRRSSKWELSEIGGCLSQRYDCEWLTRVPEWAR